MNRVECRSLDFAFFRNIVSAVFDVDSIAIKLIKMSTGFQRDYVFRCESSTGKLHFDENIFRTQNQYCDLIDSL